MALISKDKFKALEDFSAQTRIKKPGKFKTVYITGKSRKGETLNSIQVVKEWDQNSSPTFILNSQEQLYMIILFIKRIRQKVEDDRTKCFNYNDKEGSISISGRTCPATNARNNGFCDECRFAYIFAGCLLDETMKTIPDDEGNPVLIGIKHNGMKFMPASEYVQELQKQAEQLPPISDDLSFELNVVAPRRFITKVTVGQRDSKHGEKNVFVYEAFKKLPDKTVVKILEDSEKYLSDFNDQYDLSKYMSASNTSHQDNVAPKNNEGVNTFESKDAEVTKEKNNETKEYLDLDNLDIEL